MEKIGSVEQTLKIINENDFYIKKKFGQNFLKDDNITCSIKLYVKIKIYYLWLWINYQIEKSKLWN